MFTLLFSMLSFAFVMAVIAGFFVLFYFLVRKAVKDGTVQAHEELQKREAFRRAEEREAEQGAAGQGTVGE